MDGGIGPIAEVVLKGLYEQVKTEAQYVSNFKGQFKEMRWQLELMQSFLKDCKDDKRKCETVKTASKHLRELAYAADDIVTRYRIREDYKGITGSSSFCFCLPSFKEVVYRWETGKKLTEINHQLQKMHGNHSSSIHQPNNNTHKSSTSPRIFRGTTSHVPNKIVGLEKETEKIKNWIFSGNVSFIGIAGMGGLGKTTIAQKVFNHPEVKDRFRKRIWVCVSQTYDEHELEKSILDMLGVEVEDKGCNIINPSELQTQMSDLLLANNYLIVLDDVWTLGGGWWTLISTAFQETPKHNGCVIVTSRNKQVIIAMAAHGGFNNVEIHEPKLLGKVESEELFCKFVFGRTKTKFNYGLELDKVGEEIVGKCNGLPLAIKIIGGVMASVNPRAPAEWRKKCEKFREVIIKKIEGTVSVIDSLQLSYDELPDHLKQCLLCFAIYPDDHEIEVEQLMRWWIGEGFVRGTEPPNEEAYEYLLELMNRCLVEVIKKGDFDGRVHKCKMHDMVREMVIRNAKEEAFCDFNSTGKHIATPNSLHLGVTKGTSFQSLNGNQKLRALITTYDSIGFDKGIALSKVKTLRVLDLSRLKLNGISVDDLWHWITSLKLLAYLNLQDVALVVDGKEKKWEIPPSIRKLWGLQVLVLKGCTSLESLPSPMPWFPRLKVLDVGNCSCLSSIPQCLSRLSSTLQELYGFKVPKANIEACSRLRDLKELEQLEVLHVDIMEGSLIQGEDLTALGSLEKLRVLSINASGITDPELLQKLNNLSVPQRVKHLYLRRFCLEATPPWINPSSLPDLQFLCIEESQKLIKFSEIFCEGKWMVEGMCLKFLPKLEVELEWLKAAMPQLRYLEVSHCNSMQSSSSPFPTDDLYTWEKPKEEEEEEESCNVHKEEDKQEEEDY